MAVVQTLLQTGANVNLQCCRKRTALHAACDGSCNVIVVEELLRSGANVNMISVGGETPLMCLGNLHSLPPIGGGLWTDTQI